uniref:Acetyl-CoA carboxylase biotin carboxyl carrier protein subunit n=1 Tax=Ignisphaera aggregans TaxID=334771 RepID=A0A7J2U269_9CREN
MQWQKVVVREKDRDIEVLIAVERENVFRVKIGEREYIVEMTPKGVFTTRLPKEASGKQEVIVTSEVPGRVVEVFVKEGDAINEGDLIAIVESMKMEIEITSPRRGIVEKVYVVRGSFVREGNALVKLRAE